MRCLALAEAWQDSGGHVHFVLATTVPALEARILKEGFDVIHIPEKPGSVDDATETSRIAGIRSAQWVVVDGYHFDGNYQKRVKDCGHSLLAIDDYGHADHYYADLILNQNICADMSLYPEHEPTTRFLLGTKYALLRKEFLKWEGVKRDVPKVARKVLVTLGGSDPGNATGTVIEALKQIDLEGLEVIVVAGGLNSHSVMLREMTKNYPNFSLCSNVENMPDLMAWADVAISAGGTTCWELAFMGVPSILFPIAENQKCTLQSLLTGEIAKVIQIHEVQDHKILKKTVLDLLKSKKDRETFSDAMRNLVDGKGISRIILAMQSHKFKLRSVQESDCLTIWEWINDPVTRSQSFNQELIPRDEHKKWFASALANPHLIYYIAIDDQDHPIGQVRFSIENENAAISVLLDQKYRGLQLGSRLISEATKKLFDETNVQKINAYIKTENQYSIQSFKNAGYKESGTIRIKNQNAYHLSKNRNNP